MTTPPEQASALPPDLLDLPILVPSPATLADVTLLTIGAFRPLTGFLSPMEAAIVRSTARLPDGTPWPVEITLPVPAAVGATAAAAGSLVLADAESVPVALLMVTDLGAEDDAGTVTLAGPLQSLRLPSSGRFASLVRSPADVRAALTAGPVLADVVDRPPLTPRLEALRAAADALGGAQLLLLVRVADAGPDGLPADILVQAVLAALTDLGPATVIPVALAHRPDPVDDVRLAAFVAAAYGATHVLSTLGGPAGPAGLLSTVPAAGLSVELPVTVVRTAMRPEPTPAELRVLLDRSEPLPHHVVPPPVARELALWRPPLVDRGVTIFFTGLSGSGKSTIARRVADLLAENSLRRVTLLDGDEVRHLLSAGLGFSRADRDMNVRRIGWVAAQITRHGGTVICAPIAPYAAARAEVRAMVEQGGGFLLVHVSTPLAVCEQRDRKGLYAKARAGLIPAFTGVSDPYEEPVDADLVLDTNQITIDDAAARVLDLLTTRGYLASSLNRTAAGSP